MPVAPQLFQGGCVPVYETYKRSTFADPCPSCRTFEFWTLAVLLLLTLPMSAEMRHFLLLSTTVFPRVKHTVLGECSGFAPHSLYIC